jgi:homoserine dehydrogenase
MKRLRLSIIGFGTVGQGLAELLSAKRVLLRQEYNLDITLVSVANARSGFIYRENGLDIPALLQLAAAQRPLTAHPGVTHWENALEGLQATGGDVLVEATPTNLHDAEPGMSHIRLAISLGMHVVTANKGPGALAANELFALARQHGVQLRMESTVMAGTPVISTIREGMAGASIHALRGILNGTTNYILTAMAAGQSYAGALADAQTRGYAETDPTADVEGHDAVAKTLILAALVFGRSLKPGDVIRQGITTITQEQVQQAIEQNKRIKLVASLRLFSVNEGQKPSLHPSEGNSAPVGARVARSGGGRHPGDGVQALYGRPLVPPDGGGPQKLEARVVPVALLLSDPLARVDGVMNALTIATDTLSEVTIIGPGAGRAATGQGLLSDVIACAREQAKEEAEASKRRVQ